MVDTDLYAYLGVQPGAPARELKRAFLKMAKVHHPDLNQEDPSAQARFVLLTQAFEVLSDPTTRALYDEFGHAGLAAGFDPAQARRERRSASWRDDSNFETVFDDIHEDDPFQQETFGAHASGADLRREITLSAEVAAEGGVEAFEHHGDVVALRIPPNTQDGDVLCVPEEGAEALHPKGRRGDLLVTVRVEPEVPMETDGLDVLITVPISIPEALLGAKIPIQTPQGRVVMTVPEGVHSSAVLRLKGLGLEGQEDARGDVLVRLEVRAPDRLDARARDAARALEEAYTTPLRDE